MSAAASVPRDGRAMPSRRATAPTAPTAAAAAPTSSAPSGAAEPTSASEATTDGAKVIRLDRGDAAAIAVKVVINERQGKTSPPWMIDVARRMGVV